MTTLHTRCIVSLAYATMMLALGACAGRSSSSAIGGVAAFDAPSIRFDNRAGDYVHVYLVGNQRQWLLGRVEPGAQAILGIPVESMAPEAGSVRLAVIVGARLTLQAARDPRVTFAVAAPASEVLAQRWSFSQGQVMSQLLRKKRAPADHP